MNIFNIFSIFLRICSHPLNRGCCFLAIRTFLKWQFACRLLNSPVVFSWINEAKFICSKSDAGLTGNIYCGLYEYEDMSFILHYLKRNHTFVDVGANVGAFTILASAVVGAKTIAFEPSSTAFCKLTNQLLINNISDLVSLRKTAVGSEVGHVNFTSNFDTVNHVVNSSNISEQFVSVPLTTLDVELDNCEEYVVKIDVEGFEFEVLKGASSLLSSSKISALIVELNGSGARYGLSDNDIHEFLMEMKYIPIKYAPDLRSISVLSNFNRSGNTIYVRNLDSVKEMVKSAPDRILKVSHFNSNS